MLLYLKVPSNAKKGLNMGKITYAQVEVTTRCNFGCDFCSGRHMEQKDIKFETVKKIIDIYKDLKEIQLQGEGEPLLHPDFFDMVSYAKKANICVITITNGSLLTDENIFKLLESGIDIVYISIEAIGSMYNQIRKGGDYNQFINNIKRFMHLRNESNYAKPMIGFAITIMKKTKNMFGEIIGLYNDLKMDAGVMYNCLLRTPYHIQNYDNNLTDQTFSGAEERIIFHEYDEILRKNNVRFGKRPNYENFANCIWLDHRIMVNVNSNCMRCPFDKNDDGFIYGNIDNDNYEKIFETKLKLLNKEISAPLPLDCSACYIYK